MLLKALGYAYPLLRRLLFLLPAERAHHLTLSSLKRLHSLTGCQRVVQGQQGQTAQEKSIHLMGLDFPNDLGLAAGLDKDGFAIDALAGLGFGHLEIGTVTPRPQAGNPKPRLFRCVEDQALINRMGFNNQGVDQLVRQVQEASFSGILGINIGKNFDTPLERAIDDYSHCFEKVHPLASYITVNISSPNTVGLRDLQGEAYLSDLLAQLTQLQSKAADQTGRKVPLVVKISPDESLESLKTMSQVFLNAKIDGLILTNTTISRPGLTSQHAYEKGGLSGAPLFNASTQTLREIKALCGDALCLIAAGGIDSAAAAQQKREAGAELLQLYTGLIYQGPRLITDIIS